MFHHVMQHMNLSHAFCSPFALSPIPQTDALVDPADPLRFKVIVRTARSMEYMYPCEPDMTQLLREGGTDLLASSAAGGSSGGAGSGGGGGGEGTPTGTCTVFHD